MSATKKARILYQFRSPDERDQVLRALAMRAGQFDIVCVQDRGDLKQLSDAGPWDMALYDVGGKIATQFPHLEAIRALDAELPVLLLAEDGSDSFAADALYHGAWSGIVKTAEHLPLLPDIILAELEKRRAIALLQAQASSLPDVQRQHATFESMTDAFVALDRNWNYTYVNAHAGKLLGRAPEDLVGKHIWTEFPEGVDQNFNRVYQRVMQTGLQEEFADYYAPLDRWYLNRVIPTGDGLSIFFHDITQRKRTETALQARDAQLSLIFDNIGDIVFLIDVGNDNTFHFAAVSLSFLTTTGLREDQVVGQPAEKVLPQESQALVFGKYHEAIQNRSTVYWEEISEFPSGTRAGEITLTPIFDAEGRCTQLVGTIHDVSQIRRAMQEIRSLNMELEARVLQRTSELQHANQELEAFSYSVSHDLRAPLRAITGFSEILSTRHRASLNAQGQGYMDNIVEASIHMGDLIDDLLNYARLGRSTIHLRALSLDDILAPSLVQLDARAAIVGAEIVVEPLPRVIGQPSLLTQVFSNLLDNALAYRRADVPSRIRVSSSPAGDHMVEILVSDNGVGIASELQGKVFQVFQRLHNQQTHPGTGIGLAIVRKAVELMGGSIRLTSEPGVGSTFTITLPLAPDRVQ